MVVRLRFQRDSLVSKARTENRRAASALAALLDPAAVTALALGLWGIAAQLKWVGAFAIPTGLFSHWETWLGAAAALELCAMALNRYGGDGGAATV